MNPPARQPDAHHKLYFISGPVDLLLVGGATIACFLLVRGTGGWASQHGEQLDELSALMLWAVNWPHFAATNHRLYQSKRNIAQYPLTAILVPVVLCAGVAASLATPTYGAVPLVKLFTWWSPYHYSGQSLGLTLLYARRAGFPLGRWERRALTGFLYGMFLSSSLASEVRRRSTTYLGVTLPSLGLPPWSARLALFAAIGCGIVAVVLFARIALIQKKLPPLIVLVPAAAHFFWFMPGRGLGVFSLFVPAFHGAQYLLVAWAMQLKERLTLGGLRGSGGFVLRETLRWGAVTVAGGAALFWAIPAMLARLTPAAALVAPAFIAAVQIHHFFVDGVIWKLRRSDVSQPLMTTLSDFQVAAAEVAAESA